MPHKRFFTFSRIDFSIALIIFWCGILFWVGYRCAPLEYWWYCYGAALACGSGFLVWRRRSFFTLSSVFVVLCLIGLTLPVVPFLFFGVDALDLRRSIYVNSLGLIFFVAMALLASPSTAPRWQGDAFLTTPEWTAFFAANRRIFWITIPGVLLAITLSGGWQAYLGLDEGGFDRIASLKGMGPLMIFSFVNVFSAGFYAIWLWTKDRAVVAMSLVVFTTLLNGFTYGRGNLIMISMMFLTFYGLRQGFSLKALLVTLIAGIGIVLLKVTRIGMGVDSGPEVSPLLAFSMQFAGDFDPVNNVAQLIDYVSTNGYPGFYHIWSTILIYVPRVLFPGKPQDIGGVHLTTLVFPGVYLGAEGGTTFTFGAVGVWYAVAGMTTMVCGLVLQSVVLGVMERIFVSWSQICRRPTAGMVVYLLAIGQVIIMYREALYPLVNVVFYFACYWIMYLIVKMRLINETALP